jgi:hypothetical protein
MSALAPCFTVSVCGGGPETLRVVWPFGEAKPQAVQSREPDGLWQRGRQHRGTRVSAVLSLRAPQPYGLTEAEPSVWINPWAARPLSYQYPFATATAELAANQLRRAPATRAAHEIFGLAHDWPGITPFAARHGRLRARAEAV